MTRRELTRLVCAIPALGGAAAAQEFEPFETRAIAEGIRFPNGPAWSKGGYLVFSDTPGNRILKLIPGGRPEVLREAQGPAGNAFDAQGRLYTCETGARRVTRSAGAKLETLAETWEGKRLNGPNDIVVSRNGHVYFTDPAFGDQADRRELDFHGVFHISPRGALTLAAKWAGRPNGIALSPNGRILYVSNADERNVRAFDLDGSGSASNERVFVSGIEGAPAGMTVDEKGNLYVAAAKGVSIYSPEGKEITVLGSERPATDCGFGADGRSLYITERGAIRRTVVDLKGAN